MACSNNIPEFRGVYFSVFQASFLITRLQASLSIVSPVACTWDGVHDTDNSSKDVRLAAFIARGNSLSRRRQPLRCCKLPRPRGRERHRCPMNCNSLRQLGSLKECGMSSVCCKQKLYGDESNLNTNFLPRATPC